MVPPFCKPPSDDLREPRVPLRILRGCYRSCGRSSFDVRGVESRLRDVPAPRFRAEYFVSGVLCTCFQDSMSCSYSNSVFAIL